MVDTDALRRTIRRYKFYASPSSGSGNDPATVEDINKLIRQTAKLLDTFVDELEKAQ